MSQCLSCVLDPGFPVGGWAPTCWGCQPPMWVLFGGNVCENKRIGSHWGGGGGTSAAPPGSANEISWSVSDINVHWSSTAGACYCNISEQDTYSRRLKWELYPALNIIVI